MSTTISAQQYGTSQEIQEVVDALYGKTAADAQKLIENVGTDGYILLNGKKVALPLLIESVFKKFGLSAIASVLSHFAGYPQADFSTSLQSYLESASVISSLAYITQNNNITLKSLDPDAYLKGLLSADRADPRIWKEAELAQNLSASKGGTGTGTYNGLFNSLGMAGVLDNGKLRNPLKDGPSLNIKLLMWLALTGQLGLLMMILYRHEAKMSAMMSWKLMGVLNKQNEMKKKIMDKISALSESGESTNPEIATELQAIQTAMQQVRSHEELVTGILSNLKEQLKNLFELVMSTLRTEGQMGLTAARRG